MEAFAWLYFPTNFTASPLELAAQALAIVRVQEFARLNRLALEEREGTHHRDFVLNIPAERMNEILWELDLAGLLQPNQTIAGDRTLHTRLEERFASLTWVDSAEG